MQIQSSASVHRPASVTVRALAPGSQPASAAGTAARDEAAAGSARETTEANRHTPQAAETEAVRAEVRELAARDREVRAHERAHLSSAGGLARGGMSLDTQRGPNGRQYAVAGEVQIDTSAVPGDPQATIAKARRIRDAALAPANPSSQDRQVAAQATAMEMSARAELAVARVEAAKTLEKGGGSVPESARSSATVHDGGDCAMCGGTHARAEHVAGNERRLAASLADGVTAGGALDLSA